MKHIRIGNIEYRETKNIVTDKPYEEIVCHYPNPYYGKEEKMKSDGWVFDDAGSAARDNSCIDSSCFKDPTSLYTVATVEWNNAHDEYDIRSIGRRAFLLENEDRKDFDRVLDVIDSMIEENHS